MTAYWSNFWSYKSLLWLPVVYRKYEKGMEALIKMAKTGAPTTGGRKPPKTQEMIENVIRQAEQSLPTSIEMT